MLATTCTEICEGQALDVSFESRDDILPEEYLEMVELKPAVLYWNTTDKAFYNTTFRGTYTTGGPPTGFGRALNRTFLSDPTVQGPTGKGIAFNVNVYYRTGSGIKRVQMVNMGQPSDQAAVATRTVTLYDDDRLYGPSDGGAEKLGTRLSDTGQFYAPDVSTDSGVYNVVVVEVVTWRM